jgi:hypothetical protein
MLHNFMCRNTAGHETLQALFCSRSSQEGRAGTLTGWNGRSLQQQWARRLNLATLIPMGEGAADWPVVIGQKGHSQTPHVRFWPNHECA